MIQRLMNKVPVVNEAIFLASNASIIGDVVVGEFSSVWFGTVIRGDMAPIRIGSGTNIQDLSMLHVDTAFPLSIGAKVTVGHGAILHGCTIHDEVLIGMGSCILNGAVISRHCMVGARTLVTPGKSFPEGSLIIGTPARVIRALTTEEIDGILQSSDHYISAARNFAENAEAILGGSFFSPDNPHDTT